MKKQSLSNSQVYRSFVTARDVALEDLYKRAMSEISDVLRGTFETAALTIKANYDKIESSKFEPIISRNTTTDMDRTIDALFVMATQSIVLIQKRLRRTAFKLAKASETEAIGRALQKKVINKIKRESVESVEKSKSPSGGELSQRIDFVLSKLRRRLMTEVSRAAIISQPWKELAPVLFKIFPKSKSLQSRRRILKKAVMLEADRPGFEFGIDQISDEEWGEIVADYMAEYVPRWRGPDSVLEQAGPKPTKDDFYAWELEQEMTQDFVKAVREGQIEAAKDEGITEFIWIAIVDDKTDDCCMWRDGLLTSEIEYELKTKRADDECKSAVPPAHFNCRCTLAPATEYLPESPPTVDLTEFNEWLSN